MKTIRIATIVAALTLVGIAASPAAVGRAFADDSHAAEPSMLPGDSAAAFWPHETGALMGTSETYLDVRDDGSYYDLSIGRRVFVASQSAR